ncbi:CATRA conflict system CASPASE/TPR repeat-associated protein [Streptomyces sp. NPDC054932]
MSTAPSPAVLGQRCLVGYVVVGDDEAGRTRLRDLWAAALAHWPVVDRSGPGSRPPFAPPFTGPSAAAEPVGDAVLRTADTAPGTAGLQQVVLRRYRDRLCVAVTLSPPDGDWQELLAAWERVVPPGSAPGTAVLLTAVAPAPWAGAPLAEPTVRAAVDAALPPSLRSAGAGTPVPMTATTGGLLVTEVARGGGTGTRSLVVVAPAGGEDELDRWTWTDGTPRLAPVGRYLLHTAGLDRLAAAVASRSAVARTAVARVEEDVAALVELVRGATGPGIVPTGRALLIRTATDLLEPATLRARLAQDARDAGIVAHNLRVALGGDLPDPPPGSPMAADLDAAGRVAEQAEDLGAWLASVDERGRYATAAAETAVAEQVRLAAEAAAGRHERITTRNTAVIGSLLMLLAAVQSLAYDVPVPRRVEPALITLLACLALLLASSVPGQGGGGRGRGRTVPVVAALLGVAAAVGWCAESWVGSVLRAPVDPGRSLSAALLAAGLAGTGLLGVSLWRGMRGRGRGTPRPPMLGP